MLNPGAYTHYSYALMDALESVHALVPAIEVHMSNIQDRDSFRHISVTAPECLGQIAGFGKASYKLAMHEFKLLEETGGSYKRRGSCGTVLQQFAASWRQ